MVYPIQIFHFFIDTKVLYKYILLPAVRVDNIDVLPDK